MRTKFTTLQLALGFSFAVHAALLTLRFAAPEAFNRVFEDTPLEVILVNARANEAPSKAQAIAQANLSGGGQADKGRATSPLPPATTTEIGEADETTQRRIEKLQEAQQQLLAQLRRELAQLPAPDPQQPDEGKPEQNEQEEHRRQLIETMAEIEKRINNDNARPKKRYISPATREAAYALYYDVLRRRIEERGTRNFPQFQGAKLYGELIMNITVDAKGEILETEIVKSSGQPMLDKRAQDIVRASAPFEHFNGKMRSEADQLVITSRFNFTRDDDLKTTQLAPVP
jgi:periplasmic protein TonB